MPGTTHYRPLVSVIVRYHNSEKWLVRCLDSIFLQTYRNWELVLWNDYSSDGSWEICRDYQLRKPARVKLAGYDPKTTITDPEGPTIALAKGIACSTGELITFVDSDDWIEPNALNECVAELESQVVGLTYTLWDSISLDGKCLGLGQNCLTAAPVNHAHQLLFISCIFHLRMFRRELYDLVGGINTDMSLASDYDLMIRLSEICEVTRIEKVLYHYQSHPGQVSKTRPNEQTYQASQAVERAIKRQGARYKLHLVWNITAL